MRDGRWSRVVSGGFAVPPAGPDLAAWEAGMLLTWLEWVEVEVESVDDGLVEGLHRLRGALMVAAVAGRG